MKSWKKTGSICVLAAFALELAKGSAYRLTLACQKAHREEFIDPKIAEQ